MTDQNLEQQLKERFAQLPKVVQEAITSADVQKRMRALADTQKLHLDQWEALENEVMLALLGFQPVQDLQINIQKQVGVSEDSAKALASEVSKIVFEPIRGELERQLQHPDAKAEALSGVEEAGKQALQTEKAPAVAPATPPAAPTEEKATRAPVSESYKVGQLSTERKEVHEDPYREPPV